MGANRTDGEVFAALDAAQFQRCFIVRVAAVAGMEPIMRSHRAIGNSLHRVMDMMFRDDECRVRTSHAPADFAAIEHMALNLPRTAHGRDSLRMRRKVAAWGDASPAAIIARR